MAVAYSPSFVVSEDGSIIAIKSVESIRLSNDDSDLIVDKLKGDVTMEIVTVSGQRYRLSMRFHIETLEKLFTIPSDLTILRDSILQKWIQITGYDNGNSSK